MVVYCKSQSVYRNLQYSQAKSESAIFVSSKMEQKRLA